MASGSIVTKPYRVFVGRPARMDDLGIILDPDPGAPKAILLEVEGSGSARCGACHFSSPEDLRQFIAELKDAGREAFAT